MEAVEHYFDKLDGNDLKYFLDGTIVDAIFSNFKLKQRIYNNERFRNIHTAGYIDTQIRIFLSRISGRLVELLFNEKVFEMNLQLDCIKSDYYGIILSEIINNYMDESSFENSKVNAMLKRYSREIVEIEKAKIARRKYNEQVKQEQESQEYSKTPSANMKKFREYSKQELEEEKQKVMKVKHFTQDQKQEIIDEINDEISLDIDFSL